ncbi:carbohydrate binding domain-containing protein [Streptomyces sp. NPDC059720]|uniref:carbohydrate binding domain-containing protein n=1 Tax=Streptomyces sp. NPDC059720 TaxID=3346924 RepID=UPI0036A08047
MAAVFAVVPALTMLPALAAEEKSAGEFVTRQDGRLQLGGKPFRFGGVNLYYLGLDENVGGVAYPSFFRIRDGLRSAKALNSTVVRAHTLGISVGHPLSIEPERGVFNPKAFATIDYAIAEAGRLGLKLTVPLSDNYAFYHGGRSTFTKWRGLSDPNAFYTDAGVIKDFQEYVSHILDHENPHTGLRLRDDPTIMSWELGNELKDMPRSWIDTMGSFLHKKAPKHLVTAGTVPSAGIDPDTLQSPHVDIVQGHYYPPTAEEISEDATATTDAKKVFVAGEYGAPSASTELLDEVAADKNVTGALAWSLFPRGDERGYVQHNDTFTVHQPGDTPAMREQVAAISAFASTMSSPAGGTPIEPDSVLITSIEKRGGYNTVTWRGSAGADGYLVQRAHSGSGKWKVVTPSPVSDNDTPWMDTGTPNGTARYRIVAVDADGKQLTTSAYASVSQSEEWIADPLQTFGRTSGRTGALQVTPAGRNVKVTPADGAGGTVAWKRTDITRFSADVESPSSTVALKVETRTAGGTWAGARTTVRKTGKNLYTVKTGTLGKTDEVRLVWPSGSKAAVFGARFTATTDSPGAALPSAFSLESPGPGREDVLIDTDFTWQESADVAYYSLVVSRQADLSDPVFSADRLTRNSYSYPPGLEPDTKYYLQLTAHNRVGKRTVTGGPVTFSTRPVPESGYAVDDFERYGTSADLQAVYKRNPGGDPITPALATTGGSAGKAMTLSYELNAANYAGVGRTYSDPANWNGAGGLRLWVEPDGSGNTFIVQFKADGLFWEAETALTGTEARLVTIPFTDFKNPEWGEKGDLNVRRIEALSLLVSNSESTGAHSITVDSIAAYKK